MFKKIKNYLFPTKQFSREYIPSPWEVYRSNKLEAIRIQKSDLENLNPFVAHCYNEELLAQEQNIRDRELSHKLWKEEYDTAEDRKIALELGGKNFEIDELFGVENHDIILSLYNHEICCICLIPLGKQNYRKCKQCEILIHSKCMKAWKKNTCPLCIGNVV